MEAARTKLCPKAEDQGGEADHQTGNGLPEALRPTADQVEEVRGLEFSEELDVETVTQDDMAERIRSEVEAAAGGQAGRRALAWQTLGVLPEDTDLQEEYADLYAGQVIGYYDPSTGALVVVGVGEPSAFERLTLAHELTHALDDQHFDLRRLDRLAEECREEAYEAGLAAVEGSAQLATMDLAAEHLSFDEQLSLLEESDAGAALEQLDEAPPFLVGEIMFPYEEGMRFMRELRETRGPEGVNDALRAFPESTEQVLHPDAYGTDSPKTVDIPDLGRRAGAAWRDLDVQDVGEAFLARMLGLQMTPLEAGDAAAGWDGGVYRAWHNGDDVVVALATVWDAPEEADQFASALRRYADEGGTTAAVWVDGTAVNALFATGEAPLQTFLSAASR
jgi:hypothetical protein